MLGKNKILAIGILLILITACNKDFKNITYTPNKYKLWIKEHYQSWNETIDDISTTLSYLPSDYKFLMDFRNDLNSLDSVPNSYNERRFFKLDIFSENYKGDILNYKATSQYEISGRLEYILSEMKNDIMIHNNEDTVYCYDVHYERNYGLNNKMSLMLAFPEHKIFTTGMVNFVYYERFFNTGKITFNINCNTINNIPQLKIK